MFYHKKIFNLKFKLCLIYDAKTFECDLFRQKLLCDLFDKKNFNAKKYMMNIYCILVRSFSSSNSSSISIK